MSDANASAAAEERADSDVDDYDEMLDTIDVAIDEARRKVENGRVYDADNERVRIKWIRALSYAVNVRRQVQNDRTLTELAEKVEKLEEETGLTEEA
jgi:hypothetical protein